MAEKKIQTALISVFSKEGLEQIIKELHRLEVRVFSTGGTYDFIREQGANVEKVENLTTYPSILDGRVKTLHPKIFGGILARREQKHLNQLKEYNIPEIDLVIVDLYPFEDTLVQTKDESEIIEKIDIGGISLIRAAAKNYKDVTVVPSKSQYPEIYEILTTKNGVTTLEDRKVLAAKSFAVSSHYDTVIFEYFNSDNKVSSFRASFNHGKTLRYGENPHQEGQFFGDLEEVIEKLHGKSLSYNNLVDIDAAIQLMSEFQLSKPTFAIMKHTNSCGIATRDNILEAWNAALAADNISAFGGIFIANRPIDLPTAKEIDKLFYEVLIAPSFENEAFEYLTSKKSRILLKLNDYYRANRTFKSLLNGVLVQDMDKKIESIKDLKIVTKIKPNETEIEDLIFANKCVKHLKSNTIVIAKNLQLLSMGCGQTSRVDALKQAIEKAKSFGMDVNGAVMASDAFFPFPDCVEYAHIAGITSVIQPGGSIKDRESIDFCDQNGMSMVTTGIRHFKH